VAAVIALVAIPTSGILILAVTAFPNLSPATAALAAMVPVILAAPYVEVSTGLLRAADRPRVVALISSAAALGTTALTVVLLLAWTRTPAVVGLARSAGSLVTLIALGWATRRTFRHMKDADVERAASVEVAAGRGSAGPWDFMRFGTATMLSGLSSAAIAYLDVIVLGAFKGRSPVALYAPAAALATVIIGIPTVVAAFYLPVVTRSAAIDDRGSVRDLHHWASRWTLALTAPALTLLIACPTQLMRLVFGHGYGAAGGPLRVLGLGVAIQIGFGFNGLTLEAYGAPGVVARRELMGLAVSFVACLVLIPSFGLYGAAWATTVGLLFSNLSCSQVLLARFGLPPWDRAMLATVAGLLLGCVASALVAALAGSDVVAVALAIPISLLTFVAAIASSARPERAAIAAAIRRRRLA
jgi:O-antigen/teichoic acid export membrane protein